jgi:hypothetical protein
MHVEYKALMDNNTWTLVSFSPHRKAIGCKWIFRIKENPHGSVNKLFIGKGIFTNGWL